MRTPHERKIMETSTVSPPVTSIQTAYRGRKMKPGKYIPGPARVFFGYCDHCHNKVVVPLEYLSSFNRYFKKETKSFRVRFLQFLISRMKVDEL